MKTLRQKVGAARAEAVRAALVECDGNIARTARLLGCSKATVFNVIKAHGLTEVVRSARARGQRIGIRYGEGA